MERHNSWNSRMDNRMFVFMRKDNEIHRSFGEYFDAQYKRLRELLSNKDRKQHLEWAEEVAARAEQKRKKTTTDEKIKLI